MRVTSILPISYTLPISHLPLAVYFVCVYERARLHVCVGFQCYAVYLYAVLMCSHRKRYGNRILSNAHMFTRLCATPWTRNAFGSQHYSTTTIDEQLSLSRRSSWILTKKIKRFNGVGLHFNLIWILWGFFSSWYIYFVTAIQRYI